MYGLQLEKSSTATCMTPPSFHFPLLYSHKHTPFSPSHPHSNTPTPHTPPPFTPFPSHSHTPHNHTLTHTHLTSHISPLQTLHMCVVSEGVWRWTKPFTITHEGTQSVEVFIGRHTALVSVCVANIGGLQKQVRSLVPRLSSAHE